MQWRLKRHCYKPLLPPNCIRHTDSTQFVANFLATYCLSAEFADPVVQLNLTTKDELQTVSNALREWGAHPDAFMAEAWGEAIAW